MAAPRVDLSLLQFYLREGRGFGHGENYKAFIQLRRWNASPVSVQTYGCVPPHRRRMHFLSRSEWLIALLLAWAGCHVREQSPLWPWNHRHPLYGLHPDLDERLGWSSGTLALCANAGIKHGFFVGTVIPYIWTMDLVATLAWLPIEQLTCALVSVKPLTGEAYTGDIDPLARGPEKLEIERQYSDELALRYFVADRSLYPGDLLGQLEFFSGAAFIPSEHPLNNRLALFLDAQGSALDRTPPIEWKRRLSMDYGASNAEADFAVHHIFWNQLVDVDLTREVQTEDPPRPGGLALREALRGALTSCVQ
jgi:hypothetical protein